MNIGGFRGGALVGRPGWGAVRPGWGGGWRGGWGRWGGGWGWGWPVAAGVGLGIAERPLHGAGVTEAVVRTGTALPG